MKGTAGYHATLYWWQWVLIALLLGTQATWIFLDARKRGTWPWLWGLYGLMSFPTALLLYWFFVIRKSNRK